MKVWISDNQQSLFDRATESAFEAYHSENPAVYREFCRFTIQAINAGRKHLGAKMIAERMRFESIVSGTGPFKINNSFVAFYARLFEKDHPQYAGIFEFRKSRADEVITI